MDSLTQAVLGASVAAACVRPDQRRKALVAGALLGTLPDLDVFIDYGDPVANFTHHRSFSHSLIVLAPFSILAWLALRRWWAPVRAAPGRWFAAVALALVTHPLLDAHTAYGTQLLWPIDTPPVMWGTVFIIDPLYTLPLLAGVVVAAVSVRRGGRAVAVGLSLGTAYLCWSWAAQSLVRSKVEESLAGRGLAGAPVFVTPTPFNTLLWRVVVMTDDGYLEGFDSLLVDERMLLLRRYPSDVAALAAARDVPAVARLEWFARGFVRAEVQDGLLAIGDLRMGQEPAYVFTHIVAERGNPHWRPVPPGRIPIDITDRALAETWRRIWSE